MWMIDRDYLNEGENPPSNFYGLPITPPEYFDGDHVANSGLAGLPPVCSCGWTRHEVDGRWFEMNDHLADMARRRSPRGKTYS